MKDYTLLKVLTREKKFSIIISAMKNGVWHSLVVRLVRDQEVASSNLVTPTNRKGRR